MHIPDMQLCWDCRKTIADGDNAASNNGSNRSAGANVMSQEDLNSPTPSLTNRPAPPEKSF